MKNAKSLSDFSEAVRCCNHEVQYMMATSHSSAVTNLEDLELIKQRLHEAQKTMLSEQSLAGAGVNEVTITT